MKKAKYLLIIMILLLSFGCEKENPIATFTIENYGDIKIELYPKYAPNTVDNFVSLINKGFYDNNTFHRLQKGFVLQGGDPTGTGTGGCGYTIKGEFSENNFTNELKHDKYVVSMARRSSFDSAGSQFFIMLGKNPSLDGKYAAFGKVIDGFDVIDKMVEDAVVADTTMGILGENFIIKKAVVDTKGVKYDEPEKIS